MRQDDYSKPLDTSSGFSRRGFVGVVMGGGVAATVLPAESRTETSTASPVACSITINGQKRDLQLDARVTLLDLLREKLQLTGTKKGCDHGQCGACTVLVNGKRMNACLSLAVMHDGDEITTIEGLESSDGKLHPMQAAFIEYDGFQCGYCTPGQICSAVALLDEVKANAPSAVTPGISQIKPVAVTDDEIRERMSGNICRCGAYPNIVAAVRAVQSGRNTA